MLKAVLFDLDGTLFDSLGLLLSGYKHAVKELLGVETRDEDWMPLIGLPLPEQMARLSEDKKDELVKVYRRFYAKHHDELLRIYPGARETVEELSRRGLLLGAVTSKKTSFARRGLEHFGVLGYFQAVVGEDEVTRHKPAADPVLCALEMLDVKPDEALMIGDAPFDIQSAHAAGVRAAAVLWGAYTRDRLAETHPDFWLERMDDILPLVERLREG